MTTLGATATLVHLVSVTLRRAPGAVDRQTICGQVDSLIGQQVQCRVNDIYPADATTTVVSFILTFRNVAEEDAAICGVEAAVQIRMGDVVVPLAPEATQPSGSLCPNDCNNHGDCLPRLGSSDS